MSEERPIGAHRFATIEDDPDNPGWVLWRMNRKGGFLDLFSDVRLRRESDNRVRCRIDTEQRHANGFGAVHGGFMMAVVDQSMFWACHLLDRFIEVGGVTLDAQTHFMGSPRVGEPIEADVEILKETGRLIFLRGLVEQDGEPVASYTGVLRKVTRPARAER